MKKYALIGNKISYSKSKILHEMIARHYKLDLEYQILDLEENMIETSMNRKYDGFNVTKPYKTKIIKYIDRQSKSSEKTNSVNMIYYKKGRIYGDNTDYYGFKYLIKYFKIKTKNKKIAVLGTGGAARTVYHYLSKSTKNVVYVSRKKQGINIINYDKLENNDFDIIINATIIGTTPLYDYSPLEKKEVKNAKIIDLNYNPRITKLMQLSNESYNGLVMLIVQAIYAQRKWNKKRLKINRKVIKKFEEELENV